ncbi:MAG: cell division protein FtsZ, partial [Anaerolineae bacterium]|nr:cell division protein FtsZ [Anaerolineae bacterium]
HPEANIIFGAVIDENLDEELRITLIATGFEEAAAKRKPLVAGSTVTKPAPEPAGESKTIAFPQRKVRENYAREETPQPQPQPAPRPEPSYDPEDLEVPTFLRKRMQKRRVS